MQQCSLLAPMRLWLWVAAHAHCFTWAAVCTVLQAVLQAALLVLQSGTNCQEVVHIRGMAVMFAITVQERRLPLLLGLALGGMCHGGFARVSAMHTWHTCSSCKLRYMQPCALSAVT